MSSEEQTRTGTVWRITNGNGEYRPETVRIDGEHLGIALASPTCVCTEIGLEPALPAIEKGLVLRLSSRTIFEGDDPGSDFIEAIINRTWLAQERRDSAQLAIHEALANAVIHGNFGISGGNATTPDAFREQGLLITSRLSDPAFSNLPVTLSAHVNSQGLEISVQDCGSGFSAAQSDYSGSDIPPSAKKGRGLSLMQASSDELRHEDNGRRVVLFFSNALP